MSTDPILHPSTIEMLKAVESVLSKHNIDFYLVGATARDMHFSKTANVKALRGTRDVDIAIMIDSEDQFQTIRDELIATGDFETTRHVIKLIFKGAIEVDMLPFGEIENDYREARIERPRLFVMDVPGLMEAYVGIVTMTIQDMEVNVCSVEGLVLLKLIAYDDRPDRTKDVTDINNLIEVYFELYSDEVYNDMAVMELYDTNTANYLELVSARVIGRKIKLLLQGSEDVLERVKNILSKRATDTWQAMFEGMEDE